VWRMHWLAMAVPQDWIMMLKLKPSSRRLSERCCYHLSPKSEKCKQNEKEIKQPKAITNPMMRGITKKEIDNS
jgi:hypothetical protein